MDIRSIAVLGDGDAPDWSRDEKGLHIKTGFRSAHSVVYKIKVDERGSIITVQGSGGG